MSSKDGYVCGFTVHEAKDLAKDGNAVDPLVVVRCLGREYKTDLKRGKLAHVKFEESFIWNDLNLTEDEFNSAMIEFELQGACVFTRNDILGSGKVQLSMVRRRPNHTYVKKWLQLSHDSQLTAKMMVTVFSYGAGDEPPRPEDLENDGEETAAQMKDLNNAVMNSGAADVHKQFNTGYHLFVQVHRAEHLGGGTKTYNPCISVEFGGHTLSTPHACDTHTMASDECFRIPVTMPVFSDSVLIRVWDKKTWSADELIVQGRLSFSVIRTHALAPKWFNFYGFDENEVPDVGQILSQGEKPLPNSYQGRILVSGKCQKVMKESDFMKPAIIKGNVQEEPASTAITLLLDIYEISGCPGKEVFAHVSYGRSSKKTKTAKRCKEIENQECMTPGIFRLKDDKGRIPPMAVVVPVDEIQQLDLVLSIYANIEDYMEGQTWQRVGFTRIKLKTVRDWTGEAGAPRWVSMKAMAHMPSSIEPGAVLLSMYKSNKALDDLVPTALPAPIPAVHSYETPALQEPAAPSSEEHICDQCGRITADGQFDHSDPPEWYCAACVQTSGADANKPEQQDLPDLIDPDALAEEASAAVDLAPASSAPATVNSATVALSTQRGAFTAAVNAISSTASAEPRRSWSPAAVGECYETVGKVLMREGELLGSRLVGSLPIGTIMEVLEVSASKESRRIRVIEEHGVEGWVSLAKESGEQLLQKREADVEDRISLEKAKSEARRNVPKPGATVKASYSSAACDKCDGPHPTDKCPFFKKARDDHKDAWANYGPNAQKSLKLGGVGGNYVLKSARVVRQPGDGSCLFHSMSYGLTGGRSSYDQAQRLREEIAAFIEANQNRKIAGDTIEEWVRWDANTSSTQYARRIAQSGWGGGIEMACCSILKNTNVHVYETTKNAEFKRISCFDVPRPAKTIHVLYQGGVHYDALVPAY